MSKQNLNLFAAVAMLVVIATISSGAIWLHYAKGQIESEKIELEEQKSYWQLEGQKIQEEINYVHQFLPKKEGEIG